MYKSWGAAIKNMDDAQAGALLKAIYAYQTGEETELDNAVSFVFDLIRDKFEDDAAKYEKQCQQKKENGRLGGLAKASKTKQVLGEASKTKQSLHDTESDTDTDSDALINESENTRARGNAGKKKPEEPFRLTDLEEKELAESMGEGNLARYKTKIKDWYLDHGRSLPRSFASEITRWYEADLKSNMNTRPRGKPPRDYTERDNKAIYAELERLSLGGEL